MRSISRHKKHLTTVEITMKNKKGQTYYVQGNTGTYKRFLKKQAAKKYRKIDLEEIKSGSHYKKYLT